jgi:hypothetical protein
MRRHRMTFLAAIFAVFWATAPAMGQGQIQSANDGTEGGGRDDAKEIAEANRIAAEKTPIPRMPDGKPDLRGAWRARGGAWTNILEEHTGSFGVSGAGATLVVDPADGKIPYQPWALKERDRRRKAENAYEDNRQKCYLMGSIRMWWFAQRFIQEPDYFIRVAYERSHTNIARMNAKTHLPDSIRQWMGDPIAHWEGDTLVIETTNINGKPWLALGGDWLSRSAKVVERITPINKDAFNLEITVTDPVLYTRPWTLKFPGPITRAADTAANVPGLDFDDEDSCHEGNVDLEHILWTYEKGNGPTSATIISKKSTETVKAAEAAARPGRR